MNPASGFLMNGAFQHLENFMAGTLPQALTSLKRRQEKSTSQIRNLLDAMPAANSRPFVLFIGDDSKTTQTLAPLLNSEFNFMAASTVADGVELIQRQCPDLILCDANKNVDIILKAVRHAQHCEIPFLLFSNPTNKKRNLSFLGQGVTDFITTPFEYEELEAKVRNHLDACRTRKILQNSLQATGTTLVDLAEEISSKCLELQRMNRMKDEFLAVLSHELRNPINVISGFSEILLTDYELPESAQKAADAIYRNAQIQNKLVTDILDISRSNTGKLTLDCRMVDFESILNDVLPSFQSTAAKKDIQVQIQSDFQSSLISGDPVRLTQVIWNLLSNALKFTPRAGAIEVEIHRKDQWVDFTVRDSGLGIDPDFLPFIFEEFHQQDSSITKNFGGLGLGLAIVRHIVELHGGTVHAFSEGIGRGASFTVSLPAIPN